MGRLHIPDFQYTANGSPQPIVPKLIERWYPSAEPGWDFIEWFMTPNSALGDRAPADLLAAQGYRLVLSKADEQQAASAPIEPEPEDTDTGTADWLRTQARRLWRVALDREPRVNAEENPDAPPRRDKTIP